MAEPHREAFEERAFNLYFIKTIKKNPKPPKGTGAFDFVSTATLSKQQLCERNENGDYVDPAVDQLWAGWKMAIGGLYGDLEGEAAAQVAHDVLAERLYQRKRWSLAHDDEHSHGEIAAGAAAYAITASRNAYQRKPSMPLIWPWDESDWKPRSAREDLVRAGAMVLAEIERIDRLGAAGGEVS